MNINNQQQNEHLLSGFGWGDHQQQNNHHLLHFFKATLVKLPGLFVELLWRSWGGELIFPEICRDENSQKMFNKLAPVGKPFWMKILLGYENWDFHNNAELQNLCLLEAGIVPLDTVKSTNQRPLFLWLTWLTSYLEDQSKSWTFQFSRPPPTFEWNVPKSLQSYVVQVQFL